jgi:hypothetical protein
VLGIPSGNQVSNATIVFAVTPLFERRLGLCDKCHSEKIVIEFVAGR